MAFRSHVEYENKKGNEKKNRRKTRKETVRTSRLQQQQHGPVRSGVLYKTKKNGVIAGQFTRVRMPRAVVIG